MGEFNYEAKILSNDVWTHAVAGSERLAPKKRQNLVILSQSSYIICVVLFRN